MNTEIRNEPNMNQMKMMNGGYWDWKMFGIAASAGAAFGAVLGGCLGGPVCAAAGGLIGAATHAPLAALKPKQGEGN